MEDPDQTALQKMGVFITIPFVLAVPPVIGYWIGNYLDKYFSTSPYISYLLLALGFAAGVREFYRIIKKYGAS